MTRLRTELQKARSQYQSVSFPGDLAELLAPAGPDTTSRSFWRSVARAAMVAAALALVVLGNVMISTGNDRSFGSNIWDRQVGKMSEFSWRSAPMSEPRDQTMQTSAAPVSVQLPDWLKPIEKPLADSGRLIVNVGKDLAHQADALIHMM